MRKQRSIGSSISENKSKKNLLIKNLVEDSPEQKATLLIDATKVNDKPRRIFEPYGDQARI